MIISWADIEEDHAYLQQLDLFSEMTRNHSSILGARLAFSDSSVEEASYRRMGRSPAPNLMASVFSESLEGALAMSEEWGQTFDNNIVFAVSEKEPLSNKKYLIKAGERAHGFCQVALLQKPNRLTREKWLSIWQGSHTQVAIETQSTYAYRQNLIEHCYGDNDWLLDAIVEENFPPEAMISDYAFYDAQDDIELGKRQEKMMTSCARFIDFDRIDVVPMSEYLVK